MFFISIYIIFLVLECVSKPDLITQFEVVFNKHIIFYIYSCLSEQLDQVQYIHEMFKNVLSVQEKSNNSGIPHCSKTGLDWYQKWHIWYFLWLFGLSAPNSVAYWPKNLLKYHTKLCLFYFFTKLIKFEPNIASLNQR